MHDHNEFDITNAKSKTTSRIYPFQWNDCYQPVSVALSVGGTWHFALGILILHFYFLVFCLQPLTLIPSMTFSALRAARGKNQNENVSEKKRELKERGSRVSAARQPYFRSADDTIDLHRNSHCPVDNPLYRCCSHLSFTKMQDRLFSPVRIQTLVDISSEMRMISPSISFCIYKFVNANLIIVSGKVQAE